jgi:AraC-like DNA-binding protein
VLNLEVALAATRMQDYIEDHLARPITLKELAGAAGYSPFHAARLFREATGMPPFEYIRARRLTMAALRLRDGGDKIIDVALDFVFDSHEGFTRAFSRQFGIAPKRYSRKRRPSGSFCHIGAGNLPVLSPKGDRTDERNENKSDFCAGDRAAGPESAASARHKGG